MRGALLKIAEVLVLYWRHWLVVVWTFLLYSFVLSGCKTNPPVPVPPRVVEVTVSKYVPLPAELTKPCDEVPKQKSSYGEAIRLANARRASIIECNGRLEQIRGLSGE